jgi:hypothetical protein
VPGGRLKSLPEAERRDLPVAGEQARKHSRTKGALRKAPVPKEFGPIDQKKPSCEQKQEHIIEPGHYYGISR